MIPPRNSLTLLAILYGGTAVKAASLEGDLRKARNATHQHPTDAQRHAGNYAKGTLIYKGLCIKIENPKDSIRSGTDKAGKKWESRMPADYGYFQGTEAIDGDAVDVFIGPDLESDMVVAIDQFLGGKYDETKFVVGVTSQTQGEKLYLAAYQKGWKLGPVSTATVPQLKEWLKNGDHKKPFKGQLVKAAAKDYGALLHKLRLRRGEYPACGEPDQPPYPPCSCGTTKAAAVGNFLRGDKEGLDWRWGLLGPLLAGLPSNVAAKVYTKAMPHFAGAPVNAAERQLFRKLKAQAAKDEIRVDSAGRNAPMANGAQFDGRNNTVTLSKGFKAPGILAHELGHARGGGALLMAGGVGKLALGNLSMLGLLSKDRNNAAAWTGAGTLAGTGLLASELDASRRGFQAIRALGGGRGAALKAFAGIPTYLGLAASPALGFLLKDKLGGFDASKRQE